MEDGRADVVSLDRTDALLLLVAIVTLLLLVAILMLVVLYNQYKTRAEVQKTQAEVQVTRLAVLKAEVKLQRIESGVSLREWSPCFPPSTPAPSPPPPITQSAFEFPSVRLPACAALTESMFTKLQTATFVLWGTENDPACCGFFVSACGVALTAAHASTCFRKSGKKWVVRASTYVDKDKKFVLEVVQRKVGDLDVAVLRLPACTSAVPFLPLPEAAFTAQQLSGAPVKLIHSSIAWSEGTDVSNFAQDDGHIITSNRTTIHYGISPYKGHSGAALLLRGEQVIGLHSEGFNDLAQEHSERSPSTTADAVRLDLPEVKAAVAKFVKEKSA